MTSIAPTCRVVNLVSFVTDPQGDDAASCFDFPESPVPTPKSGQVLVRMEFSPINPSDVLNCQSHYGTEPLPLPARVGFEGSGTVVASGGGMLGYMLKGKRVAVSSAEGLWGQYAVVSAMQCVALPDNISFEQGASTFVNPLTCASFVEIAKARKQKAIVHTAAASALGKMLVRLARQNGLDVICVVRKQKQVDALVELGAELIVNTSEDGWEAQLKEMCTTTNCSLGFDAVGGSLTGKILAAMPPRAELQVYGLLSGEDVSGLTGKDLVFHNKTVTGFHLSKYIATKGMIGMKMMVGKVTSNLSTIFATEVSKVFAMEDLVAAMKYYDATKEKVLIRFQNEVEPAADNTAPAAEETEAPVQEGEASVEATA